MKNAILMVSSGTRHKDAFEKNIKVLFNEVENEFPTYKVKIAYTSNVIRKLLKEKQNIIVDDTSTALRKLKDEGYDNVYVMSTHLLNGLAYEMMLGQIIPFIDEFNTLKISHPLLNSTTELNEVCDLLMQNFKDLNEDEALVFMGHGTSHVSDMAFSSLDYSFKLMGYSNVFVGTIEGFPELDDVYKLLKRTDKKKIVLAPLMLVAGTHAKYDMASGEDSWYTFFKERGYEVRVVLKGLGEYKNIRNLYIEKLRSVIK